LGGTRGILKFFPDPDNPEISNLEVTKITGVPLQNIFQPPPFLNMTKFYHFGKKMNFFQELGV